MLDTTSGIYDPNNPVHRALYKESIGADFGGNLRALAHNSELTPASVFALLEDLDHFRARLYCLGEQLQDMEQAGV